MIDMKVGTWYIVTKGSDDGTFEVGDHITILEDGDILHREAGGWLDSSDVKESIKGMEIQVDKEWVKKKKAALMQKLVEVESEE